MAWLPQDTGPSEEGAASRDPSSAGGPGGASAPPSRTPHTHHRHPAAGTPPKPSLGCPVGAFGGSLCHPGGAGTQPLTRAPDGSPAGHSEPGPGTAPRGTGGWGMAFGGRAGGWWGSWPWLGGGHRRWHSSWLPPPSPCELGSKGSTVSWDQRADTGTHLPHQHHKEVWEPQKPEPQRQGPPDLSPSPSPVYSLPSPSGSGPTSLPSAQRGGELL